MRPESAAQGDEGPKKGRPTIGGHWGEKKLTGQGLEGRAQVGTPMGPRAGVPDMYWAVSRVRLFGRRNAKQNRRARRRRANSTGFRQKRAEKT